MNVTSATSAATQSPTPTTAAPPDSLDYNATHTGTVVGSPTYMAPEQARGVSDVDARADLWSVGVLMYKCLTGRARVGPADAGARL